MTHKEILTSNLLDIIFENRNKQYGAYVLRKNYNQRLGLSLFIALSTTLILFFVFRNQHYSVNVKNNVPEIILRNIPIPKEASFKRVTPKISRTIPPARSAQRILTNNFKITENPQHAVPDIREFDKAIPSLVNSDGRVPTGPFVNSLPTSNNNTTKQLEEKPFEPIEKAPEFPGGMKAWVKFLSANLITPAELDAGEKKTVMIRFKVSTDGAVNGFEIIQSAGSIYDNEVIRVLKKMPKWKPAIQNGHAVSTSFSQPVTFMGVEQ
jgi:protein TonB